jgi:hypothetical protein
LETPMNADVTPMNADWIMVIGSEDDDRYRGD